MEDLAMESCQGEEVFFTRRHVQTSSGVQLASNLMGTRV